MSAVTASALLVVGSYLLGSIPFGVLLARSRGVDIRSVGSKNIGATNVARNLGKKLGLVVLVLDALKGALAIVGARYLIEAGLADPFALTAAGVAAALGHCFPVWLRFRGGKGVATALGIMLVVAPTQAGLAVALFAGLYVGFRMASIGSLAAAAGFPLALWAWGFPAPELALAVALAAIIWGKHHENIRRLLRGDENRV